MKVAAVMSSPAVTIRSDATFGEIVDQLMDNEVTGLPVVDDDGRLVGVVTEADLVSRDAYGPERRPLGLIADYLRGRDPQWVRKASGLTAGELMTAAPEVASLDDDLTAVAKRMLEHHHKRLPVVDAARRVIGVVSRRDLLRPADRSDDAIKADLVELLADFTRVPEQHDARVSVAGGLVTLHGTTQFPRDAAIIESVVGRVPGVVAVRNQLVALYSEPHVSAS